MRHITRKRVIVSSLLVAGLLFTTGCSGGGDGGGVTTLPEEDAYKSSYVVASGNTNENILLYMQEMGSLFENMEALDILLYDDEEGFVKKINDYETASAAYFSDDANETKRAAYLEASDVLDAKQIALVRQISQLVIDGYNTTQLSQSFSAAEAAALQRNILSVEQRSIFDKGKNILQWLGLAKEITDTTRSTHDDIIAKYASRPDGRDVLVKTLKSYGKTLADDATQTEILEACENLSYQNKTMFNKDIEADSWESGIADDELQALPEKKVDAYRGVTTKVVEHGIDTYKDTVNPLNSFKPDIVSKTEDVIEMVGNAKDLFKNKKIKVIQTSEETKTQPIEVPSTTLTVEDAKKRFHDIATGDGLQNLSHDQIDDTCDIMMSELAKNDGDGNDAILTTPKNILIQETQVEEAIDGTLTADLAVLTSATTSEFSVETILEPSSYTLDANGSLPSDMALASFEDVIPDNLSAEPLTVVKLDDTSSNIASDAASICTKTAETTTSVTYDCTIEVQNIFKVATATLDIFDGDVLMGLTDKTLDGNTSTQTLTWNGIEVIGSNSAVLKLTRSDDIAYKEYIYLNGVEEEEPVNYVNGTYYGDFTDESGNEEDCLQSGGLIITINGSQVVVDVYSINTGYFVELPSEYKPEDYHLFTETGLNTDTVNITSGSLSLLNWEGVISGNTITGTYQDKDLTDNCHGYFSAIKQP